MKIVRAELLYQTIPLKRPFVTALRRVDAAESFILRLTAETGETGLGAASPTAAITGDTNGSIVCALRDYIMPRLVGSRVDMSLLSDIKAALAGNFSAKAAADIAVWDLMAKERGEPLRVTLGGTRERRTVETDITVSLGSPDEMAEEAAKAVNDGYRVLKVKLGGDPALDIVRIHAVAAAAGGAELRLDANQAWNAETALAVDAFCREAGIIPALIEQPLGRYDDSSALRLCAPLLADESVFDARDCERILSTGQADLVNIKLMKCGGLTGALEICEVARRYGARCMMGCMLEGPIGVMAASHLACAADVITMADLDPPALFAELPCVGGAEIGAGTITLDEDAKGLGIAFEGAAEMICSMNSD